MHVHPAIAALRGTPASQRRHGVAVGDGTGLGDPKSIRDRWLEASDAQIIRSEMKRYADGETLSACRGLNRVLTDHAAATELVEPLLQTVLRSLREFPLGEAPFRFRVSPGLSTIRVLESSGVTLGLAAYEPLEGGNPPDTVLFSDCEVHEIVLSGRALGVIHGHAGEGNVTSHRHRWRAGDTIALRAQSQARQVLKVENTLLLLQLTREPIRPDPTRQVALDTGITIRTASGDKSASQAVMALGVLGALGEYAALPTMAQTALNSFEDPELRWEAVRQTLGLGPKRGLELLQTLAERADDPISAPAKALRIQLLDAQPELRALVE